MILFTASGLPDGGKLIPDEIGIQENSVIIKSIRILGGKQTSFPIGKIVVVIKKSIHSFFEVELMPEIGKHVSLYGFTEHEAKMIQRIIREKNIGVAESGNEDYRSEEQRADRDNGENMMLYGGFLQRVDQQREKVISDNNEQDARVVRCHSLTNEAFYLIRCYKEADFEIVYDDDEIDKNKGITGVFIRDCLTKSGRERIRKSIEKIRDDKKGNAYTNELELLLALIDKIYSSSVYQELDVQNKPRFPFGLDQKKVKEKLADQSLSQSAGISRITGRVNSFIARIENAFEYDDR
jgi:hypothetical protein